MRAYLIAFAALALAACGVSSSNPVGNIPTPVELASRTAADEQAAVASESAYKAFRLALELGVDTGVIKGERAARAAKADQTAYTALLVMRAAYKTANREDWINSLRSANIAIEQAVAIVRSK
jgi:hypothetical protein